MTTPAHHIPAPPLLCRWRTQHTPDGYTIVQLQSLTLLGWRTQDTTVTVYGEDQTGSYRLLLRRHRNYTRRRATRT